MNPRAFLPYAAIFAASVALSISPCADAQDTHAPGASTTHPSDGASATNPTNGTNANASASATGRANGATAAAADAAPGGLDIDTSLEALRAQEYVLRLVAAPNSSVRAGYAAAIVHRPVAEIVAAIHDVDHYRDFVPQFEQSQELRRSTSSQDLFVRISVAQISHLWARLRYRDTTSADGAVVIDGHALEGNVSRMDVRWRMTPIDGGANTVLEFWSLVLPAIAIPIPDSLLEGEQQSAARRGILAVRRRVEIPAPAPAR